MSVTVKVINKQLVAFDFGITLQELRLAKALDPEATVIRNTDKDVIFSIGEADEPSLSLAGVRLSAKRDLFVQMDKPVTADYIKEKYGASMVHANVVIEKCKRAIADIGDSMDDAIEEVSI